MWKYNEIDSERRIEIKSDFIFGIILSISIIIVDVFSLISLYSTLVFSWKKTLIVCRIRARFYDHHKESDHHDDLSSIVLEIDLWILTALCEKVIRSYRRIPRNWISLTNLVSTDKTTRSLIYLFLRFSTYRVSNIDVVFDIKYDND